MLFRSIFNTTRVAGEGIALAIVAALLAAFTMTALRALPGVNTQDAALAAPLLAIGELRQAAGLLPHASAQEVAQAYGVGFHQLMQVLAAISTASALLILVFLRQPASAPSSAR